MPRKLLLTGLILAFSCCYTEWGTDRSAFIFEIEFQFFTELSKNLSALFHPLVLAGLFGQIGLLLCIFLAKPKKWLQISSLTLLSVIVFFFLLEGILSVNFKIILSTFPYWILAFLLLNLSRQKPTDA